MKCNCIMVHPIGRKIRSAGKDGSTDSPLYKLFCSIRGRCSTSAIKKDRYKYYAGRGIKISESWSTDFKSFEKDMGPKPTERHSIDRKDNNKGYCKHNCRWATPEEQSKNRRVSVNTQWPLGVYKRGNSWGARVFWRNRELTLGTFDSMESARDTVKLFHKDMGRK